MITVDSVEAAAIGSPPGTLLIARPRPRLTVALLLSLLAHALLLSLQFGVRGFGLPGLQLPWEERRASAPALTVRLVGANKAAGPSARSARAEQAHSVELDKPRAKVRSASSAIATAPRAGMMLLQRAETTSHHTPPREVRKPAASSIKQSRKLAARPRLPHRKPSPAKPRPRIIATEQAAPHTFAVPAAPIDDVKMRLCAAEVAERKAAPAAATQPDNETLATAREQQRLEQIREAEAQRREQENARRQALQLEARRQAEQWAQQQAARELEEQNLRREQQMAARRLAEEDAQRQADQLAQQQAAQQLEEEHVTRQARELETQRQAAQIAQQQAAQQREAQNARRQAEQLEARRQAEQAARQEAARELDEENAQRARQQEAQKLAEDDARREAAQLEARRQDEAAAAAAREYLHQTDELAAAGTAQGSASGPDAGAAAAQGTARAPGSESTASAWSGSSGSSSKSGASTTEPHDTTAADADDGPFLLSDEDLASAKVEQVRKVDTTTLDTRTAQELASAQDTRRRTIFGGADDDIVLKMYIDSWRQATERSGNADRAPPQVRGDADVTVVIRSDGNIDSVSVNRSDDRQGMDDLVRRIAQTSTQRAAFPPDLVRRYDVIEIRRVWRFGDRLTILEAGR
jgi:hypothetical protein